MDSTCFNNSPTKPKWYGYGFSLAVLGIVAGCGGVGYMFLEWLFSHLVIGWK